MKKLSLLVVTLFVLSCNQESTVVSDDNADAFSMWVFRSVIDQQPRMITAQLQDDFYVSYYTQSGALYKAWKGIVNMEGAVYDGAHGPQPTSVGDAYIVNDTEYRPWSYMTANGSLPATIDYRGHRMMSDQFQLLYTLTNPETNASTDIAETVSSEINESGQLIFKRSFSIEDGDTSVPIHWKGNAIVIDKIMIENADSMTLNEEDVIDQKGKIYTDYSIDIAMDNTGTNDLNIKLNKPTILDPNLDNGFDADDKSLPIGAQLIGKHDCRSCHNAMKKTIGPAYVSIAKKYEHNDQNNIMLASKIKKGGSGIWGEQVMTPHPEIADYDLKEMVNYIFSLAEYEGVKKADSDNEIVTFSATPVNADDLVPGSVTRIYNIPKNTQTIPQNLNSMKPIMGGVMSNFGNLSGSDFKDLEDDFALVSTGYLHIEQEGQYDFRLWSDDGSKFYINEKEVVNHDGLHGTSMRESSAMMKEGYHPFRLEFFQGGGGKFLSLNYKKSSSDIWEVVPTKMFMHDKAEHKYIDGLSLPMSIVTKTPGDKQILLDMHPSFTLGQARPDSFEPKVGGMDVLPDGRLIVSLWDEEGGVYIMENVDSDNPADIKAKKIAQGLAEPLGVKVVDGRIFIMQKQEMTELIDTNGDDIIDEYRTHCDDWGASDNFHEFSFGLAEKDGYLYANLSTGIQPGGAGVVDQPKDRGSCIKVSVADGTMSKVATGLRTPNGIGVGYGGDIYIADNQGDWLPSSKILHVREGDWFGSRAVDFEGTAQLKEKPPVVWLPQDEIGNSPTTPIAINVGPYKNQMIHGEVTHGGVKRVFVDEVNGELQGCVFRFMQGMEAGVNRLTWSPDGKTLYAGGIGNPGNWQQSGKKWYGLQKMTYNDESTFEMLAVRAQSNGIEIEMTEALVEGDGWSTDDYEIVQWYYKPTADYGGPKLDETTLNVKSASVSDDRKKIFLELDGMKENHVIYIRIKNHFISEQNHSLWSTEGWYTMNQIPNGKNGKVLANNYKKVANALSASEKANGWELLFDGQSLDQFKGFKTDTISSKWTITDGTIYFDPSVQDGGGDIITKESYKDFELNLEWKISNCGNSGIFYNVVEDDKYCCTWQTGPEMQILDNTCHPDTKYETHRAGDLYDMIACNHVTVNPALQWNKVRIISKDQKMQFWLNGYKVVDFTMGDENWTDMIANSKFKDMPDFGKSDSGHIALQDHGDPVWFRNIKIKRL